MTWVVIYGKEKLFKYGTSAERKGKIINYFFLLAKLFTGKKQELSCVGQRVEETRSPYCSFVSLSHSYRSFRSTVLSKVWGFKNYFIEAYFTQYIIHRLQMCNSVHFSKFTKLCNHHNKPILKHLYAFSNILMHIIHPLPQAATSVLSFSINLPFGTFHISTMVYLLHKIVEMKNHEVDKKPSWKKHIRHI